MNSDEIDDGKFTIGDIYENQKNGMVTYFNDVEGYGFIRANDEDFFVHRTQLKEEIKRGDMVSFRRGSYNGKNNYARNVSKL